MKEFLESLRELGVLGYVLVGAAISFIGLGFVFVPGRLLGLVTSYRVKNTIAITVICGVTFLYFKGYRQDVANIFQAVYSYLLHISISIIVYTTICMRLFDRIDSLLDSKGLKDGGFKEPEKKTVSRKRTKK